MKANEIKTARLLLRPMGPEYLQTTHAYSSDAALTRFMMFLPNETLEETRRFVEDCAREWAKPELVFCEFAVLLDGAHIGAVNLELNGARDTAELGWIMAREYQGHGYASEAAAAAIDFGVRRLGIRRFIAHCDAENRASLRVMRKLGMTLTDDSGTRTNRGSDEVRREYTCELTIKEKDT